MSDDHLQREREFIDRSSAAQFEEEMPLPTEHMRALLEILGPVQGQRVLDAGCGAGELTLEIARKGGRAVGFDLSFESVRLMGARAQRMEVRSPDGLVSVMERLPFP